jgi:hypothetical protein
VGDPFFFGIMEKKNQIEVEKTGAISFSVGCLRRQGQEVG